ncbi:MAG: cytochrome c biogenesis protein CcsA [Paludibacteraceae bacterium]|nr:cytochrome c biogenesis protein CcsA [Paludibacteraceae bacterium]
MEKKLNKVFGIIYTLLLIALATATVVEDRWGSNFSCQYIYGNVWFVVLWGVFAVTGAYKALKERIWENLPSMLMHIALGTILLGALLTYATGERGYVHLIKATPVSTFDDDDKQCHQLPFTMVLDSFSVRNYPGTDAPMDYVSYMKVDGKDEIASMNRNYVKDGYRFCQSSFDDNGIGSWLSVNHDPYGCNTTFAGYVLFIIAGILSLICKNGTYRKLLNNPLLKQGGLFLLALLISGAATEAYATDSISVKRVPVLPKDEAKKLERKQVIYQNRVVPFNTVAIDFVKKIYGSANYKGLMPEQVVGGWSIAPEIWRNEKIIKIKNANLRQLLGIEGNYCSLGDLFDNNGKYRLQEIWNKEQQSPEISKLEKSITETDEKVGIILMLGHNTLMKELPKDGSVKPLSDAKVSAELLYNKAPFTKVLFMVNLTLGLLAFGLFIYKGISKQGSQKWIMTTLNILPFVLGAAFLVLCFSYGLRWYISGRIPLNNGFETMQFLALCIMLIALLLCKRYRFVLAFGFLLSGFTLLVAHLGQMNPQITPLMPVLNSPWLSTHVSMIMMSYALFAFMMLNSVFALVLMRDQTNSLQVAQLTLINKLLLYPAVILIGIGILLGAVWANESWGNYWTWDPKEVWALITFMVYGAAIAMPEARLFKTEKSFHWFMAAAFLTVLMTYFGVNYLLGGMHSYANA